MPFSLVTVFHSSQVEISAPFQTLCVWNSGSVPDLHAGFTITLVCIPRKGGVCCLAEIWNYKPLQNYGSLFDSKVSLEYSFSVTINSNMAFLFACLNIYFCDRRIHLNLLSDFLDRCLVICTKLSSSSVNYSHLLQVLFCGIRSKNVMDGIEVGILVNCE